MPFRGSLKACIESGIERLRLGQSDYIVITTKHNHKYYTLYHPSEYDAKLLGHPHLQERIVITASGGELASIIGTAQMQLNLGDQTNVSTDSLESRKQPRNHDDETVH